MPPSPDPLRSAEALIDRFAGASMFAEPGGDDGFGRSCSLLGKLRDLGSNDPVLGETTVALHSVLDRMEQVSIRFGRLAARLTGSMVSAPKHELSASAPRGTSDLLETARSPTSMLTRSVERAEGIDAPDGRFGKT